MRSVGREAGRPNGPMAAWSSMAAAGWSPSSSSRAPRPRGRRRQHAGVVLQKHVMLAVVLFGASSSSTGVLGGVAAEHHAGRGVFDERDPNVSLFDGSTEPLDEETELRIAWHAARSDQERLLPEWGPTSSPFSRTLHLRRLVRAGLELDPVDVEQRRLADWEGRQERALSVSHDEQGMAFETGSLSAEKQAQVSAAIDGARRFREEEVGTTPVLEREDDLHSAEVVRGPRELSSHTQASGTNLALGATVEMSSVGSDTSPDPSVGTKIGAATFAVDGNTGADYFQNGCAQTYADPASGATTSFPWIRVDLGKPTAVGLVKLYTRSDTPQTLKFWEFRVGSVSGNRWDENVICSSDGTGGQVFAGVTPDKPDGVVLQPGRNSISCEGFGSFLFILIRSRTAVLSICEVEVEAKGPYGLVSYSVPAARPFNLDLMGIGLSPTGDRIRIVHDKVFCGTKEAHVMDAGVLELTSPKGAPTSGDRRYERWANVTVSRSGYYKVCWCGNTVDGCTKDDVFSQHVARLQITGNIATVANTAGKTAGNATAAVANGVNAKLAPIQEPRDVAVLKRGLFLTEANTVKFLDLIKGDLWTVSGDYMTGNTGAPGSFASQAKLSVPFGVVARSEYLFKLSNIFSSSPLRLVKWPFEIYFSEMKNHQVRKIQFDATKITTNSDARVFSTFGRIFNVAGTGMPGYSGDGKDALFSRLDNPAGLFIDHDDMLWIADMNNNRIRIIYINETVTSDRQGNIYTAIGEGPQGYGGIGVISLTAQLNKPMFLTVSFVDPLEENDEDGRMLRALCYFTEHANHIARRVQMFYGESCGFANAPICGIIDRFLGTPLVAGTALGTRRDQAQLNSPTGITFNSNQNMVYVADAGNHRIVAVPVAQIVSMGCWRDSTDPAQYVLVSLENPNPPSPYLVGDYLKRQNPVKSCFGEALRLGYSVFGMRQKGMCVSAADAHQTYQRFATSTTCVDGLGSTTDNNIYKIIAPGQTLSEMGGVFPVANKAGAAGYDQGGGSTQMSGQTASAAIDTKFTFPRGIQVDSDNNNIWIADSNNNRIRVIYGQVGPDPEQPRFNCVNGQVCNIEVRGNGILASDRVGVFKLGTVCGDPDALFEPGFFTSRGVLANPAAEIPSDMFDAKIYDLGVPKVKRTGDFKVCFCPDQRARNPDAFVGTRSCKDSRHFVASTGILRISGPDMRSVHVRTGEAFHVLLRGLHLHIDDRIMLLNLRRG